MTTKVTVKYVGEDDYGEHRFDFKAPGREETCWCHTEAQYTAALLAFMLRELQPANSPIPPQASRDRSARSYRQASPSSSEALTHLLHYWYGQMQSPALPRPWLHVIGSALVYKVKL